MAHLFGGIESSITFSGCHDQRRFPSSVEHLSEFICILPKLAQTSATCTSHVELGEPGNWEESYTVRQRRGGQLSQCSFYRDNLQGTKNQTKSTRLYKGNPTGNINPQYQSP